MKNGIEVVILVFKLSLCQQACFHSVSSKTFQLNHIQFYFSECNFFSSYMFCLISTFYWNLSKQLFISIFFPLLVTWNWLMWCVIICTYVVVPPLRCFGMLLSPGQKVSNSNMHLLDMVSHSLLSFSYENNFFALIKNNLAYLELANNCFFYSSSIKFFSVLSVVVILLTSEKCTACFSLF